MLPHHQLSGEEIMFYKHWKKIALALTAFFWSGCNDNSTSSKEHIACSFTGACPEYGVAGYYCEDERFYAEDVNKNCTYIPAPKCSKYYYCEDGVSCWAHEDETVLKCSDKQDKEFSINEKDFLTKYYIEDEE
jgi:hypothetical protein